MRLFTRLLALSGLILAMTACGGGDAPGEAVDERRRVSLASAAETVLPAEATAPAEVLSGNISELSADVSARVATVLADVGSTVAQGEPILLLDDTDYRLALDQAEARVSSARAALDLVQQRVRRAQALVERQFVSEDEVVALTSERDAAQAQLDIALADRRVAQRNVEKTRITAPFDGVVVERFAQVGTLAGAGSPLLRFVEQDGIEIEAAVQAADAQGLREATTIAFHSRDGEHPVRLLRLAPVVDRGSRTQVARLAFQGGPAPAGISGTLRWTAPGQRLPANLLVRRDGSLGYFIVEDATARFVGAPDAQEGRAFAVLIQPSARLVVQGQQALSDGDPVVEAPAAQAETGGIEPRAEGDAPATDAATDEPR